YLYISRSGVGVPVQNELEADLERLERISVEIIYLVNDILSVARDHRKNKQNIVFSIATERGISWADAVPHAMDHLRQRIDAFRSLSEQLHSSSTLGTSHRGY